MCVGLAIDTLSSDKARNFAQSSCSVHYHCSRPTSERVGLVTQELANIF